MGWPYPQLRFAAHLGTIFPSTAKTAKIMVTGVSGSGSYGGYIFADDNAGSHILGSAVMSSGTGNTDFIIGTAAVIILPSAVVYYETASAAGTLHMQAIGWSY